MADMLNTMLSRSIAKLSRRYFAGAGMVLALHRVVPAGHRSRQPDNLALEITPESLEALVAHLRLEGCHFAALDEIPALLATPRRQRFVCFTFDDGYVDNMDAALPVLERHRIPFAVNIATAYADRRGVVWWYVLEAVLERLDRIRTPWLSGAPELPLGTVAEKVAAFETIAGFLRTNGQPRRDEYVQELAAQAGVDALKLSGGLMMDWEQVRRLARSERVTIGAHTVNHPTLNRLDEAAARAELWESKLQLEAQLGRPVRHLAYPFGGRSAVGPREFRLAAACGFETAVTTRSGCLFPGHRQHLHSLPRLTVSGNSPAVERLRWLEAGMERLRGLQFRRLVTD
jgi:peptidoglycan/xylan/chitin deacetylase (PgdA/CDA1 family)